MALQDAPGRNAAAPDVSESAAWRRQFPLLSIEVHGKPLHYLDNAATSQMPESVLQAIEMHERGARANVLRSVHWLAEAASTAYEEARAECARYLGGVAAEEVIFTSGCTGAINLVAQSFGALLEPGDEILISELEHHSNIVPWQMLRQRRGIVLKALPVTDEGRLDLGRLESLVGPRTRLLALTHASNVTGAITDVARLAAAARTAGARLLLDGAQYAAHGPLDLAALGVDFYVFSGHKMFAPNGIGVLWAKGELLERMPPFLGGGEMIRRVTLDETTYAEPPHRFEAGTPPIAQAVGLGAAMRWIASLDRGAVERHLDRLTKHLLGGLKTLDAGRDRIRIIGPESADRRLGTVSFAIQGVHPHDVCQILDRHGVALRGGHHCAQPLHDRFGLAGTTRASLALYNDAGDIEALLSGLEDAMLRLLGRNRPG